jgi:hypothetical protein
MKHIIDQHSNYILEQIKLGKSAYSISKILQCDKSSVLRFLKRQGVKSSHKCKVDYNNLMKNHSDEIIRLYQSGISGNQIGKQLGYSSSQITEFLNKQVEIRPRNIYAVDKNYFNKIDTQEKAYTLGWWYSDGNVMPDGKIRVCIQQEDEYIIQWLKEQLQYTGPLYYKSSRPTSPKPQVELCINRQTLAQDLIKLGCIPNKSMLLKFPTEDQVPKNLIQHFVRGYFDGDGSVNKTVQIVGTWDFCQGLKDVLPCEITNIYQRYKDRPKLESSHQLFIGTLTGAARFYHWIYTDATMFLKRKMEKFYLDT